MMRLPPPTRRRSETRALAELRDGFRYAFGFAPIRSVLLLVTLISLMGMPYTVLMPVIAAQVLHGGPHTLGFLMGAMGIGALAGAVYLASRASVVGLGRVISAAAILFGSGLVAFSLSRHIVLSLVLMVVTGVGFMVQLASSNTVIQTIVREEMRGRVMAFYTMAFMGTAPFGSLMAGVLATRIGAPNTILLGGVVCIAGGLAFRRQLPRLREMVVPIYVERGILPRSRTAWRTRPRSATSPSGEIASFPELPDGNVRLTTSPPWRSPMSVLTDLRFALRLWRRHPTMVAVAGISLGLGVGATTTMYSVVNKVAHYKLGFKDVDRLVIVSNTDPDQGNNEQPPDLRDRAGPAQGRHLVRGLRRGAVLRRPGDAVWHGRDEPRAPDARGRRAALSGRRRSAPPGPHVSDGGLRRRRQAEGGTVHRHLVRDVAAPPRRQERRHRVVLPRGRRAADR
jgi:MFS family permease